MNKMQSVLQWTAYSLIASAALAACTIVGIHDNDTHTSESPTTQTDPSVAGIRVPDSVIAEIRADNPDAVLTQCATVSDDNCYWDAVSRGNNNGYSFIAWHGRYYYGTQR